jgi:hypothetical protein
VSVSESVFHSIYLYEPLFKCGNAFLEKV